MFDVYYLMYLAVALLDSCFLAICHMFAAGYCARTVLPSFIVLAINSLPDMKNQKMSLVRIAAFSGGYCVPVPHCTTYQCFYCFVKKMLIDQIVHALHLIVVYKSLQTLTI